MTEILPNLWLGGLDLIYDLEFLKENKITHVVSVIEDDISTSAMYTLHIKQMLVRIMDRDDAPIADAFERAVAFIDEALTGGGAVYVHCLMGISRSPTIVAAYLIKRRQMTRDDALSYLVERRPIVDPNDGFRTALLTWSEQAALLVHQA
jgi:dual specificity phosphatase 12